MTNKPLSDETLDRALAELPKAVEPERDLWPGIEQRIQPAAAQPVWQWAAAATLLLAVGALFVRLGESPGEDAPVISATPAVTTAIDSPITATRPLVELTSYPGEQFGTARDAEIERFEAQLARLPEAERIVVERNLVVIRSAIAEIDAALTDNPDSAALKQLLLSSYRQELDTMNRVNSIAGSMRDDL